MIKKLFEFDRWADERVLEFLNGLETPPPKVVRWIAHITVRSASGSRG